jgi:phosphoglycolate phosphatase
LTRAKLFIFDLDGTLVDSSGDLTDAVSFALTEIGLPPHDEQVIRAMIGDGLTTLLKRALGQQHVHRLEEARELFRTFYDAHLVDQTRPYDGMRELLEHLKRPMGVATNKPGNWARVICQRLSLEEHFSAIVGDNDGHPRKPDPAMVLSIQRSAGVAVADTILIGDSLVDIETARAAGIGVCAVAWGYTPKDLLERMRPDYMVDTPAELLRLARF